jgi:hypothetical protein
MARDRLAALRYAGNRAAVRSLSAASAAEDGVMTDERASAKAALQRSHIRRRAVEAAVWGMPAVNTDLMRQEMLSKTTGKPNQFIYWGRPLDWHNQTLTPNPDSLDRVVQSEPWIERDRAMIDQLRSIGIEKGKAFAGDGATQEILADAIAEAKALLEKRYDEGFPPFYPNSHWMYPTAPDAHERQSSTYADRDRYAVDARGVLYTYAFVAIKRLGAAQAYLLGTRDKDGNPFDGGRTCRLTVPPNPPVEQYWSVTAYDRHPRAHPQHVACEPLVAGAGDPEERRWLDRRLLRPVVSARQAIELGAHRSEARVRADRAALRTRQDILRQGLGAAGRRKNRLSDRKDRHVVHRAGSGPGDRRQLHTRRIRPLLRPCAR